MSSGRLYAVGQSLVPLRVNGKDLVRYQYLLFPKVKERNHEQRHMRLSGFRVFRDTKQKTHFHSVMTLAVAGQVRDCLQAEQLSAFQRRLSIRQWIIWSILRNFLSFRFYFLYFPLLLFFHVSIFPPLSRILRLFISASCETNSMQEGGFPPPQSLYAFSCLGNCSLSLSVFHAKTKVHRRVYKSPLLRSLVYYLNPINKVNQHALN